MKHSTQLSSETREQILAIIFQFLDPDTTNVFLFGSQAEQTSTIYSDIDIGVITQKQIADSIFMSLNEGLNYNVDTLRRIDLVDFRRVDKAFRQFATQRIELWHTALNSKEKLLI